MEGVRTRPRLLGSARDGGRFVRLTTVPGEQQRSGIRDEKVHIRDEDRGDEEVHHDEVHPVVVYCSNVRHAVVTVVSGYWETFRGQSFWETFWDSRWGQLFWETFWDNRWDSCFGKRFGDSRFGKRLGQSCFGTAVSGNVFGKRLGQSVQLRFWNMIHGKKVTEPETKVTEPETV